MKIDFAKMHGLGNDFMVVDLVTQPVELDPAVVRAWGDRNCGVGFDQLLAVEPPLNPEDDFQFTIFNTDGTRAEQCGNGARCFAKFVVDQGLTIKRELTLGTTTGSIQTALLEDGQVEVRMPVPNLDHESIPYVPTPPRRVRAVNDPRDGSDVAGCDHLLDVKGHLIEVTPVSMGNPHAVIFVDDVNTTDVDSIGEALQHHDAFPEQVNVSFLEVVDRRFARLRVFERGVGETLACGSGACASMVAGCVHDRLNSRAKLSVAGGKLRMEWDGPGEPVVMTGPAKTVFHGRVDL